MVAATSELLGVGIYTPEEAALYARVKTKLLNRWLYGAKGAAPIMKPQLRDRPEKIVTFLDFIQSLAIRAIRVKRQIPLQKIRQAIEKAEDDYGVSYPFARKHTTYLFGKEIVIALGDDSEGERKIVQLTGKNRGNRLITKIAEFYMTDLTFGPAGLASAYVAYRWNGLPIGIDPRFHFGEPMVGTTGYSARAIWEAFAAEGSIEAVADVYGVTQAEVEAGCRYYDFLLSVAA